LRYFNNNWKIFEVLTYNYIGEDGLEILHFYAKKFRYESKEGY